MSSQEYDPPEDGKRWAERRSQYLKTQHDISENEARAIAWSELGYSHSGIAELMESTEGTIKKYIEKIEQKWGLSVTFPRLDHWDTDVSLEDRSKLLDISCPFCGSHMLASQETIDAIPGSLTGIKNDTGKMYPVRHNNEVFLREARENVEPWSDQRIDILKWFPQTDHDLVCIWCLWVGEWGDV